MKSKRNRSIIFLIIHIFLIPILIVDYIFAADNLQINEPYVNVAGHPITLWQQDGLYYAFLPAACQNNTDLISDLPEGIDASSIIWMYSEHIPAVFIDTESGTAESINSDKNYKEPGTITVLEQDGRVSMRQPLEYIKGRGNTSYREFDKKPYQIKLTTAVPFLGMEEGKTWILTANASDPSLLRNALARNLAGHLGLAQSDSGVFIDLYLNGEYVGNYYVTEKVEVKKNRLPITDLENATEKMNYNTDLSSYDALWTDKTKARDIPNVPADITGGYLIERDFYSRFIKEVEELGSYFITDADECFIIQSPSYASEKQVAYINDYVQSVENAILAPDSIDPVTGSFYTELIDMDSFVRKYLLEEVTFNYDGGVASSFFYKDSDKKDGKLYAGPIWDYDVSFGNTPAYLGYLSDKPDKLKKLSTHSDSSVWFGALYEKPDFYEHITECYETEISPYLALLAEQILPELADMTAASAEMDRIRWHNQYLVNGSDESLEDSIAFLSDYIIGRKAFLDRVWIEKEPVFKITLCIEGAVYDTFSVFQGESLPEFPTPEISYAAFQGWQTENGSWPDYTTPVHEDMVFHAQLE